MARGAAESKVGRRAAIAGAIGSAAALAVGGLGRPQRASAADGGNVILGQVNEATKSTAIRSPSEANPITSAYLAMSTFGVQGSSTAFNGVGLYGSGIGTNGRGVVGQTNGHNSQVGVDGDARLNAGEGIAVRARTMNGIGVYAEATGGYGLQVVGRAVFNRSGKTTLSGGTSAKTISGHAMTGATIVVATVQGNPAGVWVRSVSVSDAADTFTIRLNKAAPAGGVVVGFFIVN